MNLLRVTKEAVCEYMYYIMTFLLTIQDIERNKSTGLQVTGFLQIFTNCSKIL